MVVSNMNLYIYLFFFSGSFLRFPFLFFEGVYVSRSKFHQPLSQNWEGGALEQQAEMQWIG